MASDTLSATMMLVGIGVLMAGLGVFFAGFALFVRADHEGKGFFRK